MKFVSKDTRERAVAAYKTGKYTQQYIASLYGVHYKTVANWLKADAEGREQCPRPKGHLKRILNSDDLAQIDQIMTADPSTTVSQLMEKIGKICSLDVYRRALKELEYTFKKTLWAVVQDREDIKKQREEWHNWSMQCDRKQLIFIDESAAKTNITSLRGWAKGRCYVWKLPGVMENYNDAFVFET